jgi:hypothetical protein
MYMVLGARVWLTIALVGFGFSGCGGKARDSFQSPGDAGASGNAAAAAGSPGNLDSGPPDPSVVRLVAGDRGLSTDEHATPECLANFHGFQAWLSDGAFDFKAFVAEPGDYTGDPVHILWLELREAAGRSYRATGGSPGPGAIFLHVDTVEPRFIGNLEAVMFDETDAEAKPLNVKLEFDIAVRAGCR